MANRPPAAQTAFGPMVITAVEQHSPAAQRLVQDDPAERFLPAGARLLVGACRWRSVRQRTWLFGIEPPHVAGLLEEYGWAEREQVSSAEYVRRYLQPIGRELFVSEIERSA